jgi:hypothetical protein
MDEVRLANATALALRGYEKQFPHISRRHLERLARVDAELTMEKFMAPKHLRER